MANKPGMSCIFLVGLVLVMLPVSVMAKNNFTVAVKPEKILIGAQYNGTQLHINGTVPAGSNVIIRLTGAPADLHLREKGKVFGLFWMNTGRVTLKNVPRVCIVDTSLTFAQLGQVAVQYNLEGLVDSIETEVEATGENIDIKKELLNLKKKENLYYESELGVTLSPDKNDHRDFFATLPVPGALSPGSYKVEAIAVRDGRVVARTAADVGAEMVGFPAWLSRLAFEKGLLYGIMATAIALVSGLAIGLVFQSRGSH